MSTSRGYDKLARFMADNDYGMFRQFRHIAYRDLLYLQAELVTLENELSVVANRDLNSDGEQLLYDGDWQALSTSINRPCGGEQWNKSLQIREKLKEYYEAILRYTDIVRNPQTRLRDMAMLRDWVSRPDLGGGLAMSGADLFPVEDSVYGVAHSKDIMSLSHRLGENDLFSRLLAGPVFHSIEKFLRCVKKPVLSDPEKQSLETNLFQYSDTVIGGVIDILGTILASVTPLVSIIILYFVKNLASRLAIVSAFTLLFSISLAVATRARRVEVFACTTAFASVQVVFIGTTSSSQT